MKRMADSVEGQVSLAMLDGLAMVLIETSRSSRCRHTMPEIGATVPLVTSDAGGAYLADIPATDRAALRARLSGNDPEVQEAAGSRLDKALRDYRHLGFACSLGEVHSRPSQHLCV